MKISGIEKEEAILRLTELHKQLDELEADLHSTAEALRKGWFRSQESRLGNCSRRLIALEEGLPDSQNSNQELRMNFTDKKVTKLELGF